jgi:hypothetical protein
LFDYNQSDLRKLFSGFINGKINLDLLHDRDLLLSSRMALSLSLGQAREGMKRDEAVDP